MRQDNLLSLRRVGCPHASDAHDSCAAHPPGGPAYSLPLGGKNGILGVAGGQGKQKNIFRGATPK